MNICVMGASLTSPNRGVAALGVSLIGLCVRAAPRARIKLLAGHHTAEQLRISIDGNEHTVAVVNCRLSPRSKLHDHLVCIVFLSVLFRHCPSLRPSILSSNKWIRAIADSDLVGDVRGGDSFSDIYGLTGFLQGFLMAWTVLLVKGDLVQFPQTFGPYKTPLARWLARYLLRRSSAVIARDRQSQAVARELLRGEGKEVLLSPDVAFSLEASRPRHVVLDPPAQEMSDIAIVGLNVNGLMYNGGYTRKNMFGLTLDYASFLTSLAIAILRESTGELWLIPHTFASAGHVESDPEACRKLKVSLPLELQARVRIVDAEYDAHEIKGVIGLCDFFIGSRMHSCIAALSQGVPCVGVAYSMKFHGVFESVGMEDWVVDGRKASNQEAVNRVLALYRDRDSVRARLTKHADEARASLAETFRRLFFNIGVSS